MSVSDQLEKILARIHDRAAGEILEMYARRGNSPTGGTSHDPESLAKARAILARIEFNNPTQLRRAIEAAAIKRAAELAAAAEELSILDALSHVATQEKSAVRNFSRLEELFGSFRG